MSEPVDRIDPHPVRVAAAVTVALIAAALLWTCVVGPAVHHLGPPAMWWIPGDVWVAVLPGGFVADGALPYLYEAHDAYVYPPGLAIAYAPLVAIGRALHLSDSSTVTVQRPTLWPLLAAVGIGTSYAALAGFRRIRWRLGDRGPAVLQVLVAIIALGPVAVIFGHYEELVVLGALLFAIDALSRSNLNRAAWLVGLALVFKQTAVLAVPLLLLQAPPEARVRMTVRMLGPVVLLAGACLLLDWEHAARSLFAARSFPGTGRPAPWVPATATSFAGGPIRSLAVVFAIVVAVLVRHVRDERTVLAAFGLVSLFRLFVEPVAFPYYLGVPLVAIVAGARTHRQAFALLALGGLCGLLFITDLPSMAWWIAYCGLLVALAIVPAAQIARGRRPLVS